MNKSKYLIGILIALTALGCEQLGFNQNNPEMGVQVTEEEHAHEAEDANPDEVHLVQEQMDVMNIELGKFQYLNLSTTVKANGQLALPPQNKASLSSVVEGRVKSIDVVEGDQVTKGQILAKLEHPDFVEIQEEYMKATILLAFREKEFGRDKQLYESGTISEKSYQEAEIDHQTAVAEVLALKAKLKMLELDPERAEKGDFVFVIPVRSPINGHVRHININMGMYILPGQEMFEIADNDHIHIDLYVYEKDIGKVHNGQKVIFSVANNPNVILQASIFAVGKSFEQEPKAMVVHAEIDNKHGDLLPGMYVDARIITNEENVRALPNDAIVSDGGLNYIFVLKPASNVSHSHADGQEHQHNTEDDHSNEFVFRKIEVNTGASDIGFTEVVPAYNLPAHVEIVTKGAFYLLAEMKKGQGGGHGHHH